MIRVSRVAEDEVVYGVLLVPLGLRVIVVNQVGKVTKGRRGNRDSLENKDPKVIMEEMATQEEVEHLEPKETWVLSEPRVQQDRLVLLEVPVCPELKDSLVLLETGVDLE